MPHNITFTSHRPETAARQVWAASLSRAEQHAARYLTAAFPDLEVSLSGGPAERPGLSFERAGCGSVLVVTRSEWATLRANGLHWELWSAAVSALHGGEHFILVDTDGSDVEEPRAAAPGSYTDTSDQDSLLIRDDGTADVEFFELSIDEMAQVLAALRDGLGRLRQRRCTRCHLPQWRHAARRSSEHVVCTSFTLACADCLPHTDAEECAQARTGQPCTRQTMRARTSRPQGGEDVLASLLETFNGWDLAALAHSAVELFGLHGDVNDELSETQKDALERAAAFFDENDESM
jgi:hypothetical protein